MYTQAERHKRRVAVTTASSSALSTGSVFVPNPSHAMGYGGEFSSPSGFNLASRRGRTPDKGAYTQHFDFIKIKCPCFLL